MSQDKIQLRKIQMQYLTEYVNVTYFLTKRPDAWPSSFKIKHNFRKDFYIISL